MQNKQDKHVKKVTKQPLTLELEASDDVDGELDNEVERRRRARSSTHVSDQLRETELPLRVALGLDALVRVGHHSNQEVDEHDYCDHLVDAEDDLGGGTG